MPDVQERDALYTPSLQNATARPHVGPLPWRLRSQFWIAFFGGSLAVTVIAFLNARRLGLEREKQGWILAVGGCGLVATLVLAWYAGAPNGLEFLHSRQGLRISARVVAVLQYLGLYKLQQSADRAHGLYRGDAYASLWKAGLLAVLVIGIMHGALMIGVKYLASG